MQYRLSKVQGSQGDLIQGIPYYESGSVRYFVVLQQSVDGKVWDDVPITTPDIVDTTITSSCS